MCIDFSKKMNITEVGPRDGFQFEEKIIPTDLKLEIISGLVNAGIKNIQATSFVNPSKVPQTGDAETLVKNLPHKDKINYSALVLNMKGLERALRSGLKCIEISLSASNTHSLNNIGKSVKAALDESLEMIRYAGNENIKIRASIQCAFGCVSEGLIPVEQVVGIGRTIIDQGVDIISLADTTGMANPVSIKNLLEKLKPYVNNIPIGVHLHDTYGLGLVNVMAALDSGVTHFDTAIAGMGGCPFIPAASGNIATEDTVYLLNSLNLDTGINIEKLVECSGRLEEFFGKQFPGKIYKIKKNI